MIRYAAAPKIADCESHGPESGSELLIVEGDSAALTVAALRNSMHQAVLPMQGKPINALTCSRRRLLGSPLFAALIDALYLATESAGLPSADKRSLAPADVAEDQTASSSTSTRPAQGKSGRPERCQTSGELELRYERVVLLFDPDADGIHCSVLMMAFFHSQLPWLIEQRRIYVARPPLLQIEASSAHDSQRHCWLAYSESQASQLMLDLRRGGFTAPVRRPFRGLASIPAAILQHTCLSADSRQLFRLRRSDIDEALATFFPGARQPPERSLSQTLDHWRGAQLSS